MRILHCFADTGAEADTLQHYGNVVRVGIDAEPNATSQAIQADVHKLPFQPKQFDLGWFHPPCGFVSPMSDTGNGSRKDWDNLIPLAREQARRYCKHWVIENKPSEYINPTVELTGHMFGLGIEYERAFECSFPVDQPARQSKLAESTPFFYSEKSKGWWMGQKGCSGEYSKEHVAKNTIPSAYINHIMAGYSEHVNATEQDYSEYDKRMQTQRRESENAELEQYL